MNLTGAAGIIVLIVFSLCFLIVFFRKNNNAFKPAAGMAAPSMEEANAAILNIEHTGMTHSQLCQVNIQVQVFPEKGRNFVAEIKEVLSVESLSALHAGALVRVSYHPANLKEVTLIKTV